MPDFVEGISKPPTAEFQNNFTDPSKFEQSQTPDYLSDPLGKVALQDVELQVSSVGIEHDAMTKKADNGAEGLLTDDAIIRAASSLDHIPLLGMGAGGTSIPIGKAKCPFGKDGADPVRDAIYKIKLANGFKAGVLEEHSGVVQAVLEKENIQNKTEVISVGSDAENNYKEAQQNYRSELGVTESGKNISSDAKKLDGHYGNDKNSQPFNSSLDAEGSRKTNNSVDSRLTEKVDGIQSVDTALVLNGAVIDQIVSPDDVIPKLVAADMEERIVAVHNNEGLQLLTLADPGVTKNDILVPSFVNTSSAEAHDLVTQTSDEASSDFSRDTLDFVAEKKEPSEFSGVTLFDKNIDLVDFPPDGLGDASVQSKKEYLGFENIQINTEAELALPYDYLTALDSLEASAADTSSMTPDFIKRESRDVSLNDLKDIAMGILVKTAITDQVEIYSVVEVTSAESGETRQVISVDSNELTQQFLMFSVESRLVDEAGMESDVPSRSEQVFEQLAMQVEAVDMPAEMREEGAMLIEDMHETTQKIQETVQVLQMEIAYIAESQELPPEFSALMSHEKPVDIQQIIEIFATIDEEQLPESVAQIYRELLEKVVLLQKMSERFGALFTVAYDPISHSLKLIPTEDAAKDPMHEMFTTFAKNLDGTADFNEQKQKGIIRFIGSLVTRLKSKSDYDLAT